MRLRQLFENKNNDVAIMFGRFNPPHYGHRDAWIVASKFPHWYIGTNQSTEGPKDPLPFEIKIEAMKTVYPEIEGHLVAEQSWFTLAVMVFKEHSENTILRIVTDPEDKNIYVPMIQKQNGIEGPHGYYKFAGIEWEKADRKSEASLVRKAVKENNPQDFEKFSGVPADTTVAGRPYFDLVREYMLPYMQAEEEKLRKQQERDRAKAEKEAKRSEKKGEVKQKKSNDDIGEDAERKKHELGMINAFLKSGKNPAPGSPIYALMKKYGLTEDAEPMDREFSLVKKLGRLGERIVENPKLWSKYDEAIDNSDNDWIVSLIMEGTGATFDEVLHLDDLFGEIGGGLGRIIDFAWAVKEGTWEEDFINPYRQHRNKDNEHRRS
jgi:nicotinamide mononucleotide adenylyltransferase